MPGDKSNNNTINANANSKQQAAYENILYSQLTKGQNSDSLNNNAQPINLNINSSNGPENLKSEPEDLSNHNHSSSNAAAPAEDLQRFNPSPSTSAKSELKQEDDEEQPGPADDEPEPTESKCNGKVKDALDNFLFQNQNSNDRASPANLSIRSTTNSPRRRSISPAVSNRQINSPDPENGDLAVTTNGITEEHEHKSDISEDSQQMLVADIKSSAEAVEHGEKFLKWLEACSDPNVTAMQVMQFKYLLNSIKLSAERQQHNAVSSGEERTRVRRRK